MRLSSYIPALVACATAAILSFATAILAADLIERSSQRQIIERLIDDGQEWVQVSVDGLQVRLAGTAPDEATRFRALSLAGRVVDSTRVLDAMDVAEGAEVAPPDFALEILRNEAGISLIGLVPAGMDRAAVADAVADLAGGADVADFLESADYPVPDGWHPALSYALDALAELPRAKISVAPNRVRITANTESRSRQQALEAALARAAPDGVSVALDISAPRPVITPFTLRFVIDADGARFDACSANTDEGRARILSAAAAAGLSGKAECTLGLGVPSPRWPDAVVQGIDALAELGGGTLTFSDADVTLVALDSVGQDVFDRVAGELESDLPDVFSLTAVLPEPVSIDGTGEGEDGPPEFVATLSPEGLLQLRGRITDERLRQAAAGFARVHFSGAEVDGAMRIDETLPTGWATRVFAGLEALSFLNNGSLVVQPDFLDIRGDTGRPEAKAEISRILSDKLGEAGNFAIAVNYEERLDPMSALPTPEECVAEINEILSTRQITFAPGSDEIDADARASIDRIARVMTDCARVPMEVGGHTDSQGRESMNQQLSQRRAEAVLTALQARRVLTSNLTARGYGETEPIADNDTKAGREANRRIEFKLIRPETAEAAAPADGADGAATDGAGGAETGGVDSPETDGADGPETEGADEQD